MSKYPAFLLYVDKFVQGTLTLTAEETGAYILLLCYQWDNNYLPLDEKKLKLIARLSGRNATNVLRTVLEKFQLIDNIGYSNKRLEVERKNYIEKRGKNVERAVNAANARWNSDANSNARSIPKAKHEQSLNNAITNTITNTITSFPKGKERNIVSTDLNFGIIEPELVDALKSWVAYRKDRGGKLVIKTQKSLEAQRDRLKRLCGTNKTSAEAIVKCASESNWDGLYKIPDSLKEVYLPEQKKMVY